MENKLGAIPLSSDILTKANIGLWAFELDEGQPPRMYADTAMLGLIGLDRPVSPEETYHAWYDHIDENAYGLVAESVEKMTAGDHAEVQYPWHHPDGRTMIVRCGGVRNFEYKAGVRIEGTHQDVTQVLHFDEEILRQQQMELVKSNLRAEALAYVSDNDPNEGRFVDFIGHRIIEIFHCDQVIFFDKSGRKTVLNTPGTESVPETLCADCPFEACRGNEKFGRDGVIVLNDCAEGYMGEAVHPDCPVKSSVIQQVFSDSRLVGWLNVNYIKEYHTFSAYEVEIMRTISAYFGLLLERIGHREEEERRAARELAESESRRDREIIEILASEYSSVYYIDLTTDGLNPYTMNEETETTFGSVFRSGITYSEAYRLYVDKLVFPEDKPMMLRAGSVENIRQELLNKKTFLTTYRDADNKYCEMKFVKVGNVEGAPMAVALGFADKDDELRAEIEEERVLQRNIDIIEILASEYSSVYYIDMTTDELDPYTMNEQTESQFGDIFRSGIKYSEAFRLYVDKLVYPEDKAMMLKAGSVYNILNELADKKTFLTQYRSSDGEYCEMKFVKVGNEENPQSVALGFSNKDREIREEIARKEKQDRDAAVISGLSDDFGCVVYTAYDDFSEVHYRFEPLFEKHIEGWSEITDFSERLNRLIETIMHPEDRKNFWIATRPETVRAAIDRDGVYYVNFRTLIDGEVTYYQAKFARDELHPDTNVIAGFHNVDAETKREMEALEQARTASKAKTDFLFNMSHDIRTPMNAIIGFTNIAMKYIDDRERVLDSLSKTKQAGELLLSLINNILDMSRIESGKIELDQDEGDVYYSFANIETTMQELAKAKNIDMTFAFDNIQDRFVYCDMSRCMRVFVNIITNAVKYTKEGGCVRVRAEQVGVRDGCGIYRYTFADNGIGMSEDFQKRVFDEFSRENTATVSGIQGTGLGLSVCRTFVSAMGGTIECKSKQGVGTTFVVTLPFKLQKGQNFTDSQEVGEGPVPGEADLSGKRVLLVEDNELNVEIARYILEDECMEVEYANDGTVAVRLLTEKGPDYYDFILMDVQMPLMNGYEATSEIRKMYPGCRLPIIAVSANAFAEDKAASLRAGMNDHVAKPINIVELKSVMAKYL